MSDDPFALARYAQALKASTSKLPRQSGASEHARVGAAWRNAIPRIVAQTPERALATPIVVRAPGITPVSLEKGRDRTWLIANEMAKRMKQILFARAKRAGARNTGSTRVVGPWTRAARESARAWMRSEGGTLAWESAFDALSTACEKTATYSVPAQRLGILVRAGFEAHNQIKRAPPWLAARVARAGPEALLGRSIAAWRAWAVNAEGATLGAPPLDETAAEEALATWAWPRCEPPLAMVALCHGTGTFASESAWANALENAKGKRRRALERISAKSGHAVAAQAAREDDEERVREVERRVRALAREGGVDVRLGEARAAWRRERALAGDGTIGVPRLVQDSYGRMAWRILVHGPEALIASAVMGGLAPEVEVTLSRSITTSTDGTTNWSLRRTGGMSARQAEAVRDAVRRVLGREAAGRALDGTQGRMAWGRAA